MHAITRCWFTLYYFNACESKQTGVGAFEFITSRDRAKLNVPVLGVGGHSERLIHVVILRSASACSSKWYSSKKKIIIRVSMAIPM